MGEDIKMEDDEFDLRMLDNTEEKEEEKEMKSMNKRMLGDLVSERTVIEKTRQSEREPFYAISEPDEGAQQVEPTPDNQSPKKSLKKRGQGVVDGSHDPSEVPENEPIAIADQDLKKEPNKIDDSEAGIAVESIQHSKNGFMGQGELTWYNHLNRAQNLYICHEHMTKKLKLDYAQEKEDVYEGAFDDAAIDEIRQDVQSKRASAKNSLAKNSNKHLPLKFHCQYCSKSFAKENSLNQHIGAVHRNMSKNQKQNNCCL